MIMETVTLSDLGPIIAAVVGPMLVMVVASMRYQHLDSTKTRKLITDSEKATLKLITDSNDKNRDLIEASNRENRDLIMRNHTVIGDVRERLARIEGHLRISPQPETSDDGDAEAA